MLPASTSAKRERPKGLWKARVMAPRTPAAYLHERQLPGSEESDIDADAASSSSSSSSKRLRRSPSLESLSDVEQIYYWDYSRRCSPDPDRVSNWATSKKIMDSSTTAGPGVPSTNSSWTYEDWEDLKELFAQATDQYENADAAEALPIIRGVMHECNRFMLAFRDPSVLFTNPPKHKKSSSPFPHNETAPSVLLSSASTKDRKRKCVELPTAFHVILGTALFMFGNLIEQDPTQAAPGEPDTPVPYWLAALDVFETGDCLPSRTNGLHTDLPDDWEMAIVWGRTLVCLTEELITLEEKAKKEGKARESTPVAQFFTEDPEWPPESPFATIAACRPPLTRRMILDSTNANELLMLAMDFFSRGIFRMPHNLQNAQSLPIVVESFSRAKELFQIGSEVLLVAEKLPLPTERQFWATWADSVFDQMKMEADMDAWRGPINRARGRCHLIVGTARSEDLEAAMDETDVSLTDSPEAQKARDSLLKALAFFERAKGSAVMEALSDTDTQELQALLAETLLTLGNLASTKAQQEEYYSRAKVEGGRDYLMDETSDHSGRDNDGDEIMGDSDS